MAFLLQRMMPERYLGGRCVRYRLFAALASSMVRGNRLFRKKGWACFTKARRTASRPTARSCAVVVGGQGRSVRSADFPGDRGHGRQEGVAVSACRAGCRATLHPASDRRRREVERWRWPRLGHWRRRRESTSRGGRRARRVVRLEFSKSRCLLRRPHCTLAYAAARTEISLLPAIVSRTTLSRSLANSDPRRRSTVTVTCPREAKVRRARHDGRRLLQERDHRAA